MRKKFWQVILDGCVLIVVVALSVLAGIGVASPDPPTISLDPKIGTAAPGEFFTLNVTITNVNPENSQPMGLVAWGIEMTFNPDIVNVSAVAEGPFLEQAGGTWWLPVEIDNDNGYLGMGNSLVPIPAPPAEGAYGSGVLASITFQVKVEGETTFHFEDEDILLHSWDRSAGVSTEISFSTVDGIFEYPVVLRDVTVAGVTVPSTPLMVGENVSINVTVKNRGNTFAETFIVSVFYDSNIIGTKTVDNLALTESEIVSFKWDTSGLAADNYTITAVATTVPDEIETDDNTYSITDVELKASSSPFQFVLPVEMLIVGAVIAVAVIGAGAFFFMRRGSAKT
jgi:hypothetical protein